MFYVGLDLGQAHDPTALAVLQVAGSDPKTGKRLYHGVHLERLALGTTYPAVVEQVVALCGKLRDIAHRRRFDGWPPLVVSEDDHAFAANNTVLQPYTLVVDATGVGRPVLDQLRAAGLKPVGVTITGGNAVARNELGWSVPKRDLVVNLQVLLHARRLKISPKLPEAETFLKELTNFKVKITDSAHDTYGAWREGDHDDLVLAVALAAWHAERFGAPRRRRSYQADRSDPALLDLD